LRSSKLGYGPASSLYHLYLLYYFAAPFLTCTDGALCWRLESWAELCWLVQLFYYITVVVVGHVLPEVQRQAYLVLLPVVHGLVWLNFFFAFGANTPNELANLRDGAVRPFAAATGTVTALVLPLVLFYVHGFLRLNSIAVTFSDHRRTWSVDDHGKRQRWWSLVYMADTVYSPLVVVGLWHLWLAPPGFARGVTDWTSLSFWSVLGLVVAFTLINGALLFLLGAAVLPYRAMVRWTSYYKLGFWLEINRNDITVLIVHQ